MEPDATLRRIALVEGTTLLLLLGVAVPLKHLAHLPAAVAVVGPLHGCAFCLYLWAVVESSAASGRNVRDALFLVLAAFVPFGSFAVAWRRRRIVARPEAG